MCRCRRLQRITDSSSVRKKFPTSVCRHSTSSTGKTLQHLWLDLNKLHGAAGADVVAVDAVAADAAGEAAGAAAAAEAAAIAGDVAAGSRRDFLNFSHYAEERAPDRGPPLSSRASFAADRRPGSFS